MRSFGQLQVGRDAMRESTLIDLGSKGHPFTWVNGRRKEDRIQCRLDRAMANEKVINRFSPIQVSHLSRFRSDHSALSMELELFSKSEKKKEKDPHFHI